MLGRESTYPVIIEDLTTLEIIKRDGPCPIAQLKQAPFTFYLLSGNLALPVSEKLIDKEAKDFHDDHVYHETCREFLRWFNPFKPEQYEILHPLFSREYKALLPDSYEFYKSAKSLEDQNIHDHYIIDKAQPWIGLNITTTCSLKLNITLYGATLISGTTPASKDQISNLKHHCDTVNKSIPVSETIREEIVAISKKHKQAIEEKKQASKLNQTRIDVINDILQTEPFKTLKNYVDNFKNKNDVQAKLKYASFSPFLQKIDLEMSGDDLDEWLNQILHFENVFSGKFTPRPQSFTWFLSGLSKPAAENASSIQQAKGQTPTWWPSMSATSPESTATFNYFNTLRTTVKAVLQQRKYEPTPRVENSPLSPSPSARQ